MEKQFAQAIPAQTNLRGRCKDIKEEKKNHERTSWFGQITRLA